MRKFHTWNLLLLSKNLHIMILVINIIVCKNIYEYNSKLFNFFAFNLHFSIITLCIITFRRSSPEKKASFANMPVRDYVETRYDIIKSPNDKRLYRGLLLSNKMKVLLISDSTTDKSAAAMDVNIGN